MGSVESAQDDSEGCLHNADFSQDDKFVITTKRTKLVRVVYRSIRM